MVLVIEVSRPAIAKRPVAHNTAIECNIVWLWFAIRWVKIPYHRLVMEKWPWGDGKKYLPFTSPEALEKYLGVNKK